MNYPCCGNRSSSKYASCRCYLNQSRNSNSIGFSSSKNLYMYPSNHGKRSACGERQKLGGKNSAMWGAVPIESSGKDVTSNCTTKDDRNVGVKIISSLRVSERIQKRRNIDGGGHGANADQLAAVGTEMTRITGCVDPKNRGRRSVRRPRGDILASWGSTVDGFQSFEVVVASKLGKNVEEVVSKKMESSPGADTASPCKASEKNAAKVEQIDVTIVDALADVKKTTGADASDRSGATLTATSAEVNGSAGKCTEQTGTTTAPDTSVEVKDTTTELKVADTTTDAKANAVTVTTTELKVSNGADANFAAQADAPTTSSIADLKKSNGEMTDAPLQSAVQTNDAVDPQQGRDAESDSKKISGLGLGNVNLSSAESALASLYGQNDRDCCIEFAVKLLMNEMPLPKEAAEVEEFFGQAMKAKSTKKHPL